MSHLGHIFGTIIGRELESHREVMTAYAVAFAEFGQTTTAEDFIGSMEVAGEMYASLGPILETFDVFVCPTTALPAVAAEHDPSQAEITINGVSVHPEWGWLMTYPFNVLSRCPVMSVPSGHAESGVPTGIQIVGRTYDDVSVFRAAAAYEGARGWLDAPDHRPSL
jgi:amidase